MSPKIFPTSPAFSLASTLLLGFTHTHFPSVTQGLYIWWEALLPTNSTLTSSLYLDNFCSSCIFELKCHFHKDMLHSQSKSGFFVKNYHKCDPSNILLLCNYLLVLWSCIYLLSSPLPLNWKPHKIRKYICCYSFYSSIYCEWYLQGTILNEWMNQ